MIWDLALNQERLLHVKLQPYPAFAADSNERPVGLVHSEKTSEEYIIILCERQAISKLFRVNLESRKAALRFYRVHLPCRWAWEGRVEENGMLYFNPERDILEVRVFSEPPGHGIEVTGELFVNFANKLWTADRNHVGLINLAISTAFGEYTSRLFNSRLFTGGPPYNHPKHTSVSNKTLLQQVFSRLRSLIFIYRGGPEGMFLGELRTTPCIEKAEVYRSRPIMSPIARFDRLAKDPRPVKDYLQKVYLDGPDPRRALGRWFALLNERRVHYGHEVDYRFMVAYGGRSYPRSQEDDSFAWFDGWRWKHGWKWKPPKIITRGDAYEWVRKADAQWSRHDNLGALEHREAGKKGKPADFNDCIGPNLEHPPQTAIGFWLFPVEALGPLWDINGDEVSQQLLDGNHARCYQSHRKIDLSSYEPELCLFHLP